VEENKEDNGSVGRQHAPGGLGSCSAQGGVPEFRGSSFLRIRSKKLPGSKEGGIEKVDRKRKRQVKKDRVSGAQNPNVKIWDHKSKKKKPPIARPWGSTTKEFEGKELARGVGIIYPTSRLEARMKLIARGTRASTGRANKMGTTYQPVKAVGGRNKRNGKRMGLGVVPIDVSSINGILQHSGNTEKTSPEVRRSERGERGDMKGTKNDAP